MLYRSIYWVTPHAFSGNTEFRDIYIYIYVVMMAFISTLVGLRDRSEYRVTKLLYIYEQKYLENE